MRKKLLIFTSLLLLQSNASVSASEETDWLQSLRAEGPAPSRLAAKTGQAGEEESGPRIEHTETSASLRTRGEHALKAGNYKDAIKLLEAALEKSPFDYDARALHAQAIEMQIDSTGSTDPALFNLCVKQWFSVFKHAEFLEDSKIAESHLQKLTGTRPRLYSTASGYLRSVMKPEKQDGSEQQAAKEVIEPLQVP